MNERNIEIRRLSETDVEDYRAIRLAALKFAPEAFGSSYETEIERPLSHFAERLQTSIVFAAYRGDEIVGMAGMRQEEGEKRRHNGFLWGVFVARDHRRLGVARAMIEAVLNAAQGVVEQVSLVVVKDNLAALALYEALGFMRFGLEPRALKIDGVYYDQVLMLKTLSAPAPVP